MCGMCEVHLCHTVRNAFPDAKKVAASRKRGEVTFLVEGEIDEGKLKRTIADTGYTVTAVLVEPCQKRGLFGKGGESISR